MVPGKQHEGAGLSEEHRSRQMALLPFYGLANPRWALAVAGQAALEKEILIYGHRERLLSVAPGLENASLFFCLPDHVFPVAAPVAEACAVGLMVPVVAEAAEQWRLSDAFGRLGGGEKSPVSAAFSRTLEILEDCWKETFQKVLPLRWRQAFAFELAVPVHLGAVGGASMQWPLAVALLRAAATGGAGDHMSFGQGPVFATGTLEKSGHIGDVGNIREKLEGFLREYGAKRPIFLTTSQQEAVGDLLSDEMDVCVIDHVNDLFRHPAFKSGRATFGKPPATGLLDSLMMQMAKDDASVRFKQTDDMVDWLLPATAQRPWYRFQLLFQRGSVRLHHGDPGEAGDKWKTLDRILRDGPQYFGADDRIKLNNAWSEYWLDFGQPERGLDILQSKEVAAVLPHASLKERAFYWAQCSQLCRAVGRFDDAVRAGENALELARHGCGSLAGRFANFTVHALITRARHMPGHGENDLAQAYRLLCESRDNLMPSEDRHACEIHLGFCRFFEAEYHRLIGSPHAPEPFRRTPQAWDHPRLFALLSAVRNTHNPHERRLGYTDDLVQLAAHLREAMGDSPLFRIFEQLYTVVRLAYREEDCREAFENFETLLQSDDEGFQGWLKRFAPAMDSFRQAEDKGPEAVWSAVLGLCDAMPYH